MDKDNEANIAVKKTIPKFLSILTIMNERAVQYKSMESVKKEIEERMPKELLDFVYDINSNLTEGLSPEEEGAMDIFSERLNSKVRRSFWV